MGVGLASITPCPDDMVPNNDCPSSSIKVPEHHRHHDQTANHYACHEAQKLSLVAYVSIAGGIVALLVIPRLLGTAIDTTIESGSVTNEYGLSPAP
jgi:hypothetical protein